MGIGFAGMAVMTAQFGLTARFRRATAPFGVDIIYFFHRWIAIGGLGLLVGHWLVLRLTSPEALGSILPWRTPGHMTAGRGALLLFAAIAATSLLRRAVDLEYDRWRVLHAALAVVAVALAFWHIAGAGYYTALPRERWLWALYVGAWLSLLVSVRLLKPWTMLRTPYHVTEVRPERGHSWTLRIEPQGHPGLRFSPGQFAWLTLRASPFRAREHPFSFSGSAMAGGVLEFTIRELGDFTSSIGDTRVGEVAYVDGPHGAFTIDRHADAPGFFFVAGGVGIAPIMSMLRTLADRGDPRRTHLVYANDHWEDVLFREEMESLRERLDLRLTHVLLEPPTGWGGETGLVTTDLLRRALPDGKGLMYFVCGPKPMVGSVQRSLRSIGVPLRSIHVELFDMV
jgi:predicted ferric reductase